MASVTMKAEIIERRMASVTVKVKIYEPEEEEEEDEWSMRFTIDCGFAKFTHFIDKPSLRELVSWKALADGKLEDEQWGGYGGLGAGRKYITFINNGIDRTGFEDDPRTSRFKVERNLIKKPLKRALKKAVEREYPFGTHYPNRYK